MRPRACNVLGLVLIVQLGAALPGLAAPAAVSEAAAPPVPLYVDFNGNGRADLVVGIPLVDVGAVRDAGAVQVFYSTNDGVSAADQFWHQNSVGILDASAAVDHYRGAVADRCSASAAVTVPGVYGPSCG